MPTKSLFGESKWLVYACANVACWVLVLIGAAIGGSTGRLPYVVMMFALCSSPILFVGRPNGAHGILAVSLTVYFATFALLDAVSLFSPAKTAPIDALVSPGEILILIGVLMLTLGFHAAVALGRNAAGTRARSDWKSGTLLAIGLALWAAGSGADLYRSLILVADNSNAAVNAGFAKLGVWLTSGLVLIQVYAGPLGIVLLSYWWATTRRRFSGLLMLGVIVLQFAEGWAVDTKSVAISPIFIMLLTRFLVQGKVPLRTAAAAVIGVMLVFPILTAKREIVGSAHMSKMQAVLHAPEILVRAIQHRNDYRTRRFDEGSSTFLQRATDKAAVEVFAANVGNGHAYRMGATLEPLLYTFVPRVLWSDKPAVNSAQTFNREFHFSEDPDTFISPTHLGELYWNFGFPGLIVGMGLAGALVGFVAVRCDPSRDPTLTRVLIVMVTLYLLVVNRGGSIGNEYVVWVRTLVLIGILHLMFARRIPIAPAAAPIEHAGAETGAPLPWRAAARPRVAPLPARYRNLLR